MFNWYVSTFALNRVSNGLSFKDHQSPMVMQKKKETEKSIGLHNLSTKIAHGRMKCFYSL